MVVSAQIRIRASPTHRFATSLPKRSCAFSSLQSTMRRMTSRKRQQRQRDIEAARRAARAGNLAQVAAAFGMYDQAIEILRRRDEQAAASVRNPAPAGEDLLAEARHRLDADDFAGAIEKYTRHLRSFP